MNIIIIAIVVVLIIVLLKKRKVKDINLGEEEVKKVLSKISGYKLLNDIMIRKENGTSQIDHILVGKKGVFVIETKDYSGTIRGEEYSKYWTQSINKRKNHFYNPIRQNYGHVKSVEKLIKEKDIYISLIVFTNKSNLKGLKTETPVIQVKKLKKFIRKYKSNIKLSNDQIEDIYKSLKRGNVQSSRARRKHVKRIIKNIS
ncbi:MAG: NERD domain-containing protein [Clostridium sp.]|uniref:nuclease-related domain-containing protein n=1 Tax=Clostridium sp. TaxID=1506 RepID=UPI001DDCB1E7|nr:nuclease-related domain-containing protein [Clostridium sp.]MBS5938840.1 NERD domain-containing protein [Clostridium sp.]MBS5949166.1 NERD domain-containing protein [Clostridium sp.]